MTEIRPELLAKFGDDPDALEWARWHVQKQIDWLNEAAALPQASDGFVQIATWCAGFMRDTLIGNRLGRAAFDGRFAVDRKELGEPVAAHRVALSVRALSPDGGNSFSVTHPPACDRLAYGERCEFDLAVTGAPSLLPRELGVYDVSVDGDVVEFTWVRTLSPEDPHG